MPSVSFDIGQLTEQMCYGKIWVIECDSLQQIVQSLISKADKGSFLDYRYSQYFGFKLNQGINVVDNLSAKQYGGGVVITVSSQYKTFWFGLPKE